jgi:hypothetical protein
MNRLSGKLAPQPVQRKSTERQLRFSSSGWLQRSQRGVFSAIGSLSMSHFDNIVFRMKASLSGHAPFMPKPAGLQGIGFSPIDNDRGIGQ